MCFLEIFVKINYIVNNMLVVVLIKDVVFGLMCVIGLFLVVMMVLGIMCYIGDVLLLLV